MLGHLGRRQYGACWLSKVTRSKHTSAPLHPNPLTHAHACSHTHNKQTCCFFTATKSFVDARHCYVIRALPFFVYQFFVSLVQRQFVLCHCCDKMGKETRYFAGCRNLKGMLSSLWKCSCSFALHRFVPLFSTAWSLSTCLVSVRSSPDIDFAAWFSNR
jgi:hypothetical protein